MGTIGTSSGTPSSNTIYYDSLLSTTLANTKKVMYDQIFKDSAFLAFLRKSNAIEKVNGGQRLERLLMYGQNSTVKTHGGYSVIDTTPQEGITNAYYDWAEVAGSITISRKEERQNSGESAIMNLLEQKIKQTNMTMREKLNSDLVLGTVSSSTFIADQAANGSYGLLPLGYFLRKANATDPTTGSVGGIAAATYDWWRHKTAVLDSASIDTGNCFALSVSTLAGTKIALRRMYNHCARGAGGAPNLVLFDQNSYETYNNSLEGQVRYTDTGMADMGFENVKLAGATCLWDEKVPDIDSGTEAITKGTAFFLNTEFYKLIIDSETDIVTTPFVEPDNQTAKTAKILFMGQATVSNLRKLGVCYALSQSIVS